MAKSCSNLCLKGVMTKYEMMTILNHSFFLKLKVRVLVYSHGACLTFWCCLRGSQKCLLFFNEMNVPYFSLMFLFIILYVYTVKLYL